LRPRFIDYQVPAAEILAVQGVNGAIGILIALHFDEGKTTRLARKTVTNKIDARGSNADLRKPFLQLLFRRGKWKIADVELLHLAHSFCPEPKRESRSALKGQQSFTGSRSSRAAGSETGTSAVSGILSKINRFCNEK
jgi:hypothetical protein